MSSPLAEQDKRNRFGDYVSQGVFLLREQEGRAQPQQSATPSSRLHTPRILSHDGRALSAQLGPHFLAGEMLFFLVFFIRL